MKVRIQGNSIRFRLKRFEVESFKTSGWIKEVLSFGSNEQQQLSFVLHAQAEPRFTLEQRVTTIQLNVPQTIADEWANTEMVGFEEKIATDGAEVTVMVEKDFKCLDRSDETEIGSYPNPMKQC